jgi:DNA polymerase-3 subunit epsilon
VRLGRRSRSEAAVIYAAARLPSRATPWAEVPYAVVDLETTGLDPRHDEIISFAAVPIDFGRIVVGGTRTATIRPERMPPPETIRIHGLRPHDLAGAPPLEQALDTIAAALAGRVVVAHAAWVERGFLTRALKSAGLKLRRPVLDTAAMAVRVLRKRPPGKEEALPLSDSARMLGLPVHRPHIAEGDALTTAQLFLALASHLDREQPQTLGSLARLSKA